KSFMIVAVLLGAAAAVVGYFGLTSLATQSTARTNANYKDVVVTATDLTFGVKLDRPMLRIARYPKDAVPEGAYATMDSVVGQTTKVFMSAREPVTAIKLSSRGGGLSMLVRPNMRAASLEVNQVSGVSGFVLPGDRVDVLTTIEQPGASENAVTRTLLQNIEVLAAGQKTQRKVHLVLRNPEDQAETKVASLSTNEMLGKQAAAPVHVAAAPRRAAPYQPHAQVASAPRQPGKVRIIRSANVSETPAVTDSTAN
ncbi:MAG: Flp pilus assembly protein CpaB, partial [Candidatus Eisenbacteria bacterium]